VKYHIHYTDEAFRDFDRLYDYLIVRDIDLADRAFAAMRKAIELLEDFPFSCRKASPENSFLRELVIPFGSAGYVLLFEIGDRETVTILAVRHQREDDYH
jgi:plasmid stabilization system protein ParE